MAAEVVAFANHPSGVILIGVEDTTGKTAGLACSQVPQGGRRLSLHHLLSFYDVDTLGQFGWGHLELDVVKCVDVVCRRGRFVGDIADAGRAAYLQESGISAAVEFHFTIS